MIPLASDLLPFPDQMRREGHLKSASPPDRLSSSDRTLLWAPFLGTVERYSLSLWIKSPGVAAPARSSGIFSGELPLGAKARGFAYSATAQKPSSMRLTTARDKIAGNTMSEAPEAGRHVTPL